MTDKSCTIEDRAILDRIKELKEKEEKEKED